MDGAADVVVEVVQRGYTVGGRLLRPALVTVGNGSVAAASDAEAATADGGGDDGAAEGVPPLGDGTEIDTEPPSESAP